MASTSTQVQQAFLQLLMSRRVLSREEAEEVLQKTAGNFGAGARDLNDCLHKINKGLKGLNLEVRGVKDADGESIVLVNVSNDDVAKKFASRIKEWEQEYLKAVIQVLAEGGNEPVHADELSVRFQGQVPSGLNNVDRQLFLRFLETEAWTKRDKHGRISLAARAFAELGDLIKSHGMEEPQRLYF